MRWTAQQIADAVGGRLTRGEADTTIETATQDSREIGRAAGDPPALFIPIAAERDGHDFIATSGAAVTLSAKPVGELEPGQPGQSGQSATGRSGASGQGSLPDGLAVVEVDDPAEALAALGRAGRSRLDGGVVIGITGSVGKTTTKDLLSSVFATDRPTHASHRSFNNELGVPLTILNAPDDTQALVLEMGARGIGHIELLASIGRPTVGIVTTVGAAHTSEFGSVEAVAQGKGELVEALPSAAEGGVAVLNADNPLVAAMAERTTARIVFCSSQSSPGSPGSSGGAGDAGADAAWVRAEDVTLSDDLVPQFRLVSDWGTADVVLGARGVHLVDNALCAAAAALASGVSLDDVVRGLAEPVLSPMRMSLLRTDVGTAVLDDTYNANPMSLEAALRSLAALPARRRIAVVGEMAELGAASAADHARMGALAVSLGIEVIAVGAPDYLGTLDADAPAALAADVVEAMRLLVTSPTGAALSPDDAVLVKGSRVAELERLVALLVG